MSVLYTIVPLEEVLAGFQAEEKINQGREVWVDGVYMQVEPIAPGMGKVIRLIHCGLDDYLNPQLSPGTVVKY